MASIDSADELSWMKASQRASSSKARDKIHEGAGVTAGQKVCDLAMAKVVWPQGATVSGFWPYRTEIDVMPLMSRLKDNGLNLCLPVVVEMDQPLIFRAWSPGDVTEAGQWDIPVPLESAGEVTPDILLVPMLAFDRRGFRLGYGGGFYDRTLEKLRGAGTVTAIGVAYHGQEVGAVVRGVNDQPLDAVLTEQEYYVPGQA